MSYIKILLYRLIFDIKSQARYRFSLFTDITVIVVLFVFFLINDTGKPFNTEYGSDYKTLLLIGYIVWTMAISAISTLAKSINFEAKNGTLQYFINSIYPMEWTLFTQFISSQVINLVVILFLIIVAKFIFMIPLSFSIHMLLPLVLCLVGMFGMGLIIAGISVLVKKVSALILFLQLFLLFITDTIPTSKQLLIITKYIPLTLTNNILRKIVVNQHYDSELKLLILSSFIFLIIGIVVFRFFLKKAKDKNVLLFY